VRGWLSRFRRQSEDEFRDEVQSHLAHITDEFVERGLAPLDARDAALRRFGNVTRHLERFREASPWFWMESLSQDLRHACTRMGRAPAFTAVVLFTLSVGIGTSTTVFSVVKTVLLDPLPYPDSDQLVRIVETVPADETARGVTEERVLVEEQAFFQWRASTKTLSHMAAYATSLTTVTTVEGAFRSVVSRVSPAIFPMLGARMSLGRPLLERDERLDSPVVVMSTEARSTCFGASADVIGRTVRLGQTEYTVVGILPEAFGFPSRETQFWVPLVQEPPAGGRARFVNVVARLRDNVSLQEATAEANVIGLRAPAASAVREARQQPQSPRYRVLPLHSQVTAAVAPALRLLMVAALLVMLIVVANVATLLLSRRTHLRQDTFIRRALGASRGRVIRQMVIETVIFGTGGTVIGIALSYGGLGLLKAMARVDVPELFQLAARQQFGSGSVLPRVDEMAIDVSALIWAAAMAVLASVLSGLGPALQILGDDCRPSARDSICIQAAGTSTSGVRVRSVLVFGQVVVATMLLVAAVLLIRSFGRMSQVPMGYDATNVLSFQLVLPQEYPVSRKEALAHELALQLSALPGVEAAGFASLPPLAGGALAYGVFQPPGSTPQEMLRDPAAPQARSVSRDYLRAMGVRLLAGRWFDESDHAGSRPVLLVTRAVARRYFGVRDPIGVQVRLSPGPTAWTIVGVVDDVHNGMPWEEPYSQFFMDPRQALHALPHLPEPMRETAALGFLSYAVRANSDPGEIVPQVRAVLRHLDSTAAMDGVMPLRDIAFGSMSRPRFYAVWSGLFALVAAVLGVIGVYASVAYAASQRTREIGIRIALGAQRSAALRLVLSHGMAVAASGVGVGLGGAFLLSRYFAGMLFGVTAADPLTYGAVACLFFGAAATASFVPAHRATRVDPVTAIRQE
jgi:putative ABC transport system permease protein